MLMRVSPHIMDIPMLLNMLILLSFTKRKELNKASVWILLYTRASINGNSSKRTNNDKTNWTVTT